MTCARLGMMCAREITRFKTQHIFLCCLIGCLYELTFARFEHVVSTERSTSPPATRRNVDQETCCSTVLRCRRSKAASKMELAPQQIVE